MTISFALLRIPLATLLLIAASGKATSAPLESEQDRLRVTLLAMVCVFEGSCGVGLLIPAIQFVASITVAGLGVLFLLWRQFEPAIRRPAHAEKAGCGCFGTRLAPPKDVEAMLPWFVAVAGLCSAGTERSQYADPVTVAAGVVLALGVVAFVLAGAGPYAISDPWAAVESELNSARFDWLPAEARASLRRYEVARNHWVSNDIAVAGRIVRLEVRVGQRVIGRFRPRIVVTDLLAVGP